MSRRLLGIVVAATTLVVPATAQGALLRDAFRSVQGLVSTSTTGESTCATEYDRYGRTTSCALTIGAVALVCTDSTGATSASTWDSAGCAVRLAGKDTGCREVSESPSADGPDAPPTVTSTQLECNVAELALPPVPTDGLP